MTKPLLIRNAIIINEGIRIEGDLLCKKGRIEQIGGSVSATGQEEEFDAKGSVLMPGLIDDQVHFREPGLTHKGDIASESAAAVAGGITSYMEMPNCNPTTTDQTRIEEKRAIAKENSTANYAFYLGATNENIEDVKSIDQDLVCGIKVFMGSSTGNMLVDHPTTLEKIFSSTPLLVATHCEDSPTIAKNEAHFRGIYGESVPFHLHPVIRNKEACLLSSKLAVSLAKKHNTRLHILHISTAIELESLFEAGPIDKKRITSEACVHHLYFEDKNYADKGALIKCNPAIKTSSDRQALLKAVRDDVIDVIATDHAPHTLEEKSNSYFKAPSGLPLVQHSLLTLLEHVHEEQLTLETIVKKTSHSVAKGFSIQDRGFLREGYWGDMVLVDTGRPTEQERIYSKCGWSPFEGHTFRSSIVATFVNGECAYANGHLKPGIRGKAIRFSRK